LRERGAICFTLLTSKSVPHQTFLLFGHELSAISLHFTHISVELLDLTMFFRIKILSFIYYLQVAGSHHVFQKKKLCFIYYQQVAGSHHVFQNKNIMFYILPTSCRIPSCFSEYKYYVLYITNKLQDPIMFFRIKILCFIYYQQVAGSHHVFQNKNIMFYILPTSCRIPSCFSEYKYYVLYITYKLQDPIMFFRI
jgi:hypothetical protein